MTEGNTLFPKTGDESKIYKEDMNMKLTLGLYFYSYLYLYLYLHLETRSLTGRTWASIMHWLLHRALFSWNLKDNNITDDRDNRDWKDCPEGATSVQNFQFFSQSFQKSPKIIKMFKKNSKIFISPSGLTHKT